jgi:hypothetical protein
MANVDNKVLERKFPDYALRLVLAGLAVRTRVAVTSKVDFL